MDEKKIRSDREQYRTDQEQYREDPAAERKTEDMIREMAEEIEIPHSVTPEAVEEALEKRSREQRRHVSAWQSGSSRDIRRLTGTERRLAIHRQEAAPRQQLHREAQTRQEDRKLAAGAMERTGSYQRKTMTRSMITLRPGRSIWTVCLRARLRREPGAAMLLRPIWILLLRVQ